MGSPSVVGSRQSSGSLPVGGLFFRTRIASMRVRAVPFGRSVGGTRLTNPSCDLRCREFHRSFGGIHLTETVAVAVAVTGITAVLAVTTSEHIAAFRFLRLKMPFCRVPVEKYSTDAPSQHLWETPL